MGGGAPQRRSDGASSSDRAALDAVAGAIAGCVQRFVVAPLDVVKIRFQVQLEPLARAGASKYTGLWQATATILKEEGVQGLWRGTVPGQLLAVPYTAVQFLTLQQCKLAAGRLGLSQGEHRRLVSFGSGAVAGVAATVASYPFDLLRTMLAAQGEPKVYRDMFHAARETLRARGASGLYSGLGVTLLEIMPYAALQFGLYDAFNAAWDDARARAHAKSGAGGSGAGPSSWQQFVCGLAAGTLAKLATHPLDVVKKRYQVAGLQRSLRYGARVPPEAVTSLARCVGDIAAREGLAGFYKGVTPSLLKAAPAAAVTLTTYEFVIYLLLADKARRAAAAAASDDGAAPAQRGR